MNAEHRIAALREKLTVSEIAAFLVTNSANVRYLTGFDNVFGEDPDGILVVTEHAAIVYTDFRYEDAARGAAAGTPWEVRIQRENIIVELCHDLRNAGISSLALESSMAYGRFRFLSEQFGGNVEVVDQWIEELRQVKDADEIARIEQAQAITDRAFEHITGFVRVGLTEHDIALELEFFMRKEGSEGVAFPSIVASGPNSALPHATVTRRVIETGDLLKLDFGARVGGYCADMTRTVVVGTASERQRDVYGAVLAANRAAIGACRCGISGADLDAVARNVLTERGFGERFGHSLGHGVGINVHELPTVGARGLAALRSGSVITIEPGVYVPGFGGVRIEDLVVVEDGGCRVLTRSPKDLVEL